MRTYIKIWGPPLLKAIKALEKVGIDSPQVCIMDKLIEYEMPNIDSVGATMRYFSPVAEVSVERCDSIISKSGQRLGEFDFYFEWFTEPNSEQFYEFVDQVEEALKPLGVKYKLETRGAKEFMPGIPERYGEEIEEGKSGGYFEVYKDLAGEYRFRLKAPNHKVIAVSEGYSSKAGCMNGIKSVMKNASVAEIEDLS